MKIVIGHIYADTKEKLEELISAVKDDDFSVAYDSGISVVVMKEVADEPENTET